MVTLDRLYKPLNNLFVLVILGLAGNLFAAFLWESYRPYLPWLTIGALALSLVLIRSHRAYEIAARKAKFALFKPADALMASDLGYTIVRPGQSRSGPEQRPYFEGCYQEREFLRGSSSGSNARTWMPIASADLLALLARGGRIAIAGQPLEGKTTAMYRLACQMTGFLAIQLDSSTNVPEEPTFSLFSGERVVLLIDDLDRYVSSVALDLALLCTRLQAKCRILSIIATCRTGPELETATGSIAGNRRYLEDNPFVELRLQHLSTSQKIALAEKTGVPISADECDLYSTPGAITMKGNLEAMKGRYLALPDGAKQILWALRLLDESRVVPAKSRVRTVAELLGIESRSFDMMLMKLGDRSFIKEPVLQIEPVNPDRGYLLHVVLYRDGYRNPQSDFDLLKSAMESQGDLAGLLRLGDTCFRDNGLSDIALRCFDSVLTLRPNKLDDETALGALVGRVMVLSKIRPPDVLPAFEEFIDRFRQVEALAVAVTVAWRLKGRHLIETGRHQEALIVFEGLSEQFPASTNPRVFGEVVLSLLDKALALNLLGRFEQEIAVYDELLRRFDQAPELVLREQVAKALYNKGFRLGEAGQPEQEIAVYDELLRRFDQAPELVLREQVGNALVNKGFGLGEAGQLEQAIAVYDELLRRFDQAPELALREQVAQALANKGFRLAEAGQPEQAIAVYDELLRRFDEAPDLALREQVGHALINKGFRLGEAGQLEQAIAVYDELLRRFDQAPELVLRSQVAKALLNRGIALGEAGQPEQAIAVYDELLRRFDQAPELALREQVDNALVSKGFRLGEAGQLEQAIAVYDELLRRFDQAPELVLREQVAIALVNKGVMLGEAGQPEQAISVYDELLSRFDQAPELALREQVAIALVNKGVKLGEAGQPEQAISVYDELLRRFDQAPELVLREQVAQALFNKAFMLGAAGQPEQEISVYDELLRRFDQAPELVLREQVAITLVNKAVRLGEAGQPEQEIAVYDELLRRFGQAPELVLREQVAEALFNKAIMLRELGRIQSSCAALFEIDARFRMATEPILQAMVKKALETRIWEWNCRD